MTFRSRMDSVSRETRELARKMAPLLEELAAKLEQGGFSSEITASFVLLQATAGFLTVEEGRGRATDDLREMADATADDLVEPQHYSGQR